MNGRKNDLVFLYPVMIFCVWLCWGCLDGVREEAAKPEITGLDNDADLEDVIMADSYGNISAHSFDEGFSIAQLHVDNDYAVEDIGSENCSIMALWIYVSMTNNYELAQTPIYEIRADDASHLSLNITGSILQDDIGLTKLDVTNGSAKEEITLSDGFDVEELTLADVFVVQNLTLTDGPGVSDGHSTDGYGVKDITFLAYALGNSDVCMPHESGQFSQALGAEMDQDKCFYDCDKDDEDDDDGVIQPDCRKSTDITPDNLRDKLPLIKTLVIGVLLVAPAAILTSCGYCPMVDDH